MEMLEHGQQPGWGRHSIGMEGHGEIHGKSWGDSGIKQICKIDR